MVMVMVNLRRRNKMSAKFRAWVLPAFFGHAPIRYNFRRDTTREYYLTLPSNGIMFTLTLVSLAYHILANMCLQFVCVFRFVFCFCFCRFLFEFGKWRKWRQRFHGEGVYITRKSKRYQGCTVWEWSSRVLCLYGGIMVRALANGSSGPDVLWQDSLLPQDPYPPRCMKEYRRIETLWWSLR